MNTSNKYANAIRLLAVDMVEAAKSGHPGMPMGMADVATVLFRDFLKFHPADPYWPNRDRFVLSAGHGSALLYSILYLTGYEEFNLDELKRFRQLHSKTPGHPEHGLAGGIETTTGPLGQGLANAVGIGIAERALNAKFGDELISYKTYVIAGDGCLMEGISQEAISLAGHLKLSNLVVLWDDNHISIDGDTSLATSDNQLARFAASGWEVHAIDGHNYEQISASLAAAQLASAPTMIACKTTIGYGSPNRAGTSHAHGSPLGEKEVELTRKQLNWPYPAFMVPAEILSAWRSFSSRNNLAYEAWSKASKTKRGKRLLEHITSGNKHWYEAMKQGLASLCAELAQQSPAEATRRSSQRVLEKICPLIPELIGGSADLTPSNNTYVAMQNNITPRSYNGSYIHYGVREHAMGAVMNGLALSGFIPYGGTFLTFSDYMRPAIRLAAIMKQQVIYVMTHDSICLGEDGPTHQPIEHLPALRAMPHLKVLRPCDALEVAQSWEVALKYQGPTIIALTRQTVPYVHRVDHKRNMVELGAYVIQEFGEMRNYVALLASGSEVHLACQVAQILYEQSKIASKVVSVPDLGGAAAQKEEYKKQLLEGAAVKVVIEAAKIIGWSEVFGQIDLAIGMDDFGASAPAEVLYKHYGFEPQTVADRILKVFDKLAKY
ncbi:MAG: transketolase [Proteobacteria bacterium]|nr:transketolase [Pseudomonadota bacterium]